MKTIFSMIFISFIFCISEIGAQAPKILWWFDTDDSAFGQSALGDIDGDGKYEIVFGCYRNDSMIYALNAEDGTLLWQFNASGYGEGCNDVAALIYDVTGNGSNEVIVPSSCNPITFCFNGSDGSIIWQTPTRGSDSPPVIVDLNNDGNLKILHGELNGWVRCIDAATGNTDWDLLVDANSWVQTAPTIVDLNNNGQLDFVVATWGFSNNSAFYAYDGGTRNLLWSVPMDDYVYHGTAVADLTGDGIPELVLGDYSGKLHVLNGSNGNYVWSYQGQAYIGAPPAIGDITGDGKCEVVIVSGSRVIALDNTGTLLWQFVIPAAGGAFRGVVLADITNDSIPEVIFGSSNGSVYALNGANGIEIWNIDLQAHIGKNFSVSHAPVIADFTGNDTLDLFIHGGNTDYPAFQNNYGRGYAIQIGKGTGPEWKMFQKDYYRSCSHCYPGQIINSVKEHAGNIKHHFFVHPVPVKKTGNLHIQTNSDSDFEITLFDLTGKMLLNDRNVSDLNLAELQLKQGVYIIHCTNKYGTSAKKITVTGY